MLYASRVLSHALPCHQPRVLLPTASLNRIACWHFQQALCHENPNVLRFGKQPAPYRGLSGPGPKCRKSLENVSRASGFWPKSLQKVSATVREVSGESPKSIWRVFLECSRTFWRLFGVPAPEARETFLRLFQHFGPQGPERPL